MHDWQYFFNHDRSNLNQSTYRIFEPEWKAEILHWFSRKDVDKEQKEDFIQALIDFDDSCGDFYRYRAYFLAAEALSQFPECSLGDAIVEQLLKWSYAYFRQDKRDWQILPKPLVKTARKTVELTDRKRVIAAFVHLVHTTESRSILRVAAEELGTLDPGNKSAIAALTLLTPVVENKQTFCQISQNPGEIPVGDETAIAAFINDIKRIPDQDISWCGIAVLGEIAVGNQTAIAVLVQLMEMTLNKGNCCEAIKTLGKIAVGNPTAIASLIKFLEINQGDSICFDAAQALWQIDPGNAVALNTLAYILKTSASASLINCVATYLLKIDPENKTGITRGNTIAITTLSEILETTQHQASEDEWERLYAAEALVKIDPSNSKAIATLSQIRESNQNRLMRLQASESLVNAVQNLEQLDLGNKLVKEKLKQAVFVLVHDIQIFQEYDDYKNEFSISPTHQLSYESSLLEIADSLTKILQSEHLPQVVITLKDYLSKQCGKNSSYRYEAVFKIIWHCAENLTYPDFYKAWHN
ncbi:HEAT repeat domain-containing protein [Nostoc sp. 'Peltigera membranacea cyanobiont' N6]|uniref:HEAT repeat domain-containing protein n=1 Tax=Nostoc sp. 'Peltigera membranacea cyanobiont' N6 TaxID=1261031 RepID=UPI000CF31B0D|nr:HEAT repeat domain-containing protein [Nostoc sp. 'Peltigera membranacea cyanobiont' N6]AVH67995.1 PBS lyase HEAT-like repeat-containing protein [Nostoc sp. 'Peltigera membranacea cyanobiont' N6]